jgi:hypothetical protein
VSATVADFSRRGARSPRQRTALADDTEQWVAAFRTPSKTESSPFEIFLIDERKCDRESAKEARRFEGIPGPGFQLSSGNHLVLRVCHARLGASDACHMRGAANREREDVALPVAWFPLPRRRFHSSLDLATSASYLARLARLGLSAKLPLKLPAALAPSESGGFKARVPDPDGVQSADCQRAGRGGDAASKASVGLRFEVMVDRAQCARHCHSGSERHGGVLPLPPARERPGGRQDINLESIHNYSPRKGAEATRARSGLPQGEE